MRAKAEQGRAECVARIAACLGDHYGPRVWRIPRTKFRKLMRSSPLLATFPAQHPPKHAILFQPLHTKDETCFAHTPIEHLRAKIGEIRRSELKVSTAGSTMCFSPPGAHQGPMKILQTGCGRIAEMGGLCDAGFGDSHLALQPTEERQPAIEGSFLPDQMPLDVWGGPE